MLLTHLKPEEIAIRLRNAKYHFPVGTVYEHYYIKGRVCTVSDYLETRNGSGDLVGFSIVVTHETMGQTVTDYDVTNTEISRSRILSSPSLS